MTSKPGVVMAPFKLAETTSPNVIDLSKQFTGLRGLTLLPRATFVDAHNHIWLCCATDAVLLSKPSGKVSDIVRGHSAAIESAIRVKTSGSGREVWTLAVNGQICFWDERGKLLSRSTSDRPIYSLAMLPNFCVALGNEHSVEIWTAAVRACAI